jgi:hypothetical protein
MANGTAAPRVGSRKGRTHIRMVFVRPCHPRAIGGGQPRWPADSHGQHQPTHELAAPRSSSMNASREHA